jgi:hypothetical protein
MNRYIVSMSTASLNNQLKKNFTWIKQFMNLYIASILTASLNNQLKKEVSTNKTIHEPLYSLHTDSVVK